MVVVVVVDERRKKVDSNFFQLLTTVSSMAECWCSTSPEILHQPQLCSHPNQRHFLQKK